MRRKSEKLIFYCDVCKKPIARNVCPVHGIDYVSIKKIPIQANEPNRSKQTQTRPQPPSPPGNSATQGLARIDPDDIHQNGTDETGIARVGDVPPAESTSVSVPALPSREPTPEPQADPQPPATFRPPDPYVDDDYQQDYYNPPQAYDAIDAEAEPYYEDGFSDYEESSRWSLVTIIGAIIIAAGIVSAVAYFAIGAGEMDPTSLYSKAEQTYNEENYTEARALYATFVEKYPEDPLLPIVKDKLTQLDRIIANSMASTPEGKKRIQQLMLKANIAFNKRQFSVPKDDNALSYLQKIIKISPDYAPALDMQEKIYLYFENEAQKAEEASDFKEALRNYQILSSIKPQNTAILSRIQFILSNQKDELSGGQ